MKIVNIHEAKAHLSQLVDMAAKGSGFVIAKAGKPMVKVIPFDAPETAARKRIGFLKGQLRVPPDVDTMHAAEVESLFDDPS